MLSAEAAAFVRAMDTQGPSGRVAVLHDGAPALVPARIIFAVMCGCLLSPATAAAQAAPRQDWSHYVRIAGHGLKSGNAPAIIAESKGSNVFGIEVDNDIPGRYESFLDPKAKLEAIREAAVAAHAAGNRAFVYIAGLECITAHADKTPHSLFKDHPDWVQRQLHGTPAVFGGGVAFWVAPGDEDVWISPYAPAWRSRYMHLVRQVAATGIDGVYVDIPYWMTHFEGWERTWASFDDYTVAAFQRDTGFDARNIRLGDASDPRFRRWIDFRIRTITEFMKEIDSNVKAVNPGCLTIAEIYPGIEEAVPRVGADVYELYPVVDAIAHEYQGPADTMAASKSAADWLDQIIGMFAFRAFAGGKASWMLNYSWDGERGVSVPESMKTLFGAQLTAGANTWDAKGHVMSGSNDMAMRTEAFGWIARHEETFYDAREPIDPIGVYFSPQTRNYFAEEYTKSFKGVMKLVLQSHREFQIVTPRTLARFRGRLLILPDARCISDEEIAAAGSARLLITGDTGSLQADGVKRRENPFHDAPRAEPGSARFAEILAEAGHGHPVSVNAPPLVVSQIARVHGKLHVFLDNFKGVVAKRKALPDSESDVEVSFDESAGSHIYVLPFLGEAAEVPARRNGGRLVARIPGFSRAVVAWCEQ